MKKSKKTKKSNTWKIKQHRDQFYKKSKTLGYRSRSAFKLIELNKKYKFIKKNTKLLDIGAYPGGWSQVSSKIIKSGKILSLDLKKMDQLKNVSFLQSNFDMAVADGGNASLLHLQVDSPSCKIKRQVTFRVNIVQSVLEKSTIL